MPETTRYIQRPPIGAVYLVRDSAPGAGLAIVASAAPDAEQAEWYRQNLAPLYNRQRAEETCRRLLGTPIAHHYQVDTPDPDDILFEAHRVAPTNLLPSFQQLDLEERADWLKARQLEELWMISNAIGLNMQNESAWYYGEHLAEYIIEADDQRRQAQP